MKIFFELVYFIFPLLFAGLLHHLVIIKYNLFPYLSMPIDCNWRFIGKPLFGKSKTWRGVLLVPLLSGVGSLIISQILLVPTILHPFFTGLLLGVGYSISELPNSFIKRRLDIPAGEKANTKYHIFFLVLDQTDSIIGSILILLLIYPASFTLCISILIIGTLLHFAVDQYLFKHGYKKLRKNRE